MFVKRNKEVNDEGKLVEEQISPSSHEKITPDKAKSYKEQAILVIKMLKESGTDIYAEGRYGGMYLHQKNNKKSNISENLKNVFSEKKETINNKDSEKKEHDFQNLFNVLKSK